MSAGKSNSLTKRPRPQSRSHPIRRHPISARQVGEGGGGISPERRGSDAVVAGEGYLDKVAVAQRLGVKPKTVGAWAKQGRLPAYRLGPYLRFKWAEVEAHLAATCRMCGSEMGGQHA